MITKEEVKNAQSVWGEGVVKIGKLKEDRFKCEKFANEFLDNLYAFDLGEVLFKPTKCEHEQFRPSKAEALSYFISGENRACHEDKGFAINPWTNVRFENSGFILERDRAISRPLVATEPVLINSEVISVTVPSGRRRILVSSTTLS